VFSLFPHQLVIICGRVISQPTELRDMMATFLDAAGALEPIAYSLEGMSRLRLAEGKTDVWRPRIDMEHDIVRKESIPILPNYLQDQAMCPGLVQVTHR